MTVKDQRDQPARPVGGLAEPTRQAPQPSPPEDPASIRADIAVTRSALGSTVEELADRVSPAAQTKRVARRLRSAGDGAADVMARWRVPLLAVAAGAVGVVALILIRARRR